MRHIVICLVGLALSCTTGCSVILTQMKDKRDDWQIRQTNRFIASKAWGEVKHCYDDLPYQIDFEKGFKRGYMDRASGLNGCPPALPPRRYWRAKLMGHEAMSRANAWFDGYRHGVVVSEQDGNADLARVPTSVPAKPHCPNETFDAVHNPVEEISPHEYMNVPMEEGPSPEPLPSIESPATDPAISQPTTAPPPTYDEAVPGDAIPEIPPAPVPDISEPPATDPSEAPGVVPFDNNPPPAIPPGDPEPAAPGTATL